MVDFRVCCYRCAWRGNFYDLLNGVDFLGNYYCPQCIQELPFPEILNCPLEVGQTVIVKFPWNDRDVPGGEILKDQVRSLSPVGILLHSGLYSYQTFRRDYAAYIDVEQTIDLENSPNNYKNVKFYLERFETA